MITTQNQIISPVDALWALYQSQSRRVKKEFSARILAEEKGGKVAVKKEKSAATLLASVEKARQEYKRGETIEFNNAADAQKWMDAL